MIDINTVHAQHAETGVNPYNVPDDVQSNPHKYGDPYDDMCSLLGQININLQRMSSVPDEMRWQPRQMQMNLSTTAPWNTTIMTRTTMIVITASVACVVGVQIGTGVQQLFNFASADTKVLPYITQIGAGVDLLLTTTAGTVTGYFIAYPMG